MRRRLAALSPPGLVRAAALLGAPVAGSETFFDARVVAAVDGDTIEVLARGERMRIRRAGIDTPERGQPRAGRTKRALARG